ncbi:Zinc finger and BTB domain-containing protein 22 [Merluccius polli]|uniref:Zinc finger and BTB domain-containing protein 22 n=1 Tax=Merluccius polli TaxID=89951 RepID=A0AA47MWW2_MERPO|nr:Zinc finger and BTB domain-containing protein 22 [Merluccius polli]
MQSTSGAAGGGAGGSGDPAGDLLQVCFPGAQSSVLDSLNRQREDGQLCDLSIQVQGQLFRAHRCVLAASSPYFHDQVLLKNMSTVCIPAVMDSVALESVLSCAYTGPPVHGAPRHRQLPHSGQRAADVAHHRQATASKEEREAPPPSRPSLSESQSPSSTNYFSPRHGSGLGGGGATGPGASGEGGGANTTPSYCTPSGGEEAFLIEEEEEEEEEGMYHQRKRGGGGGDGRRKDSACEQEVGVSDSFGVSSYQFVLPQIRNAVASLSYTVAIMLVSWLGQGGEERPGGGCYSQSSTAPRKQWVVVKTEHPEDDDLILVSGEEEEEEEEDEDEEMALARERERNDFNISNVRSLSSELGGRPSSDMDTQSDYCQSSEDYLRLESSLLEHTMLTQGPGRAGSSLLGQPVQTLARPPASPPLDAGAHHRLQHGAVHLAGLPPDGMDPGAGGMGGGASGGGGGGASGKLFMCHCGKTFTHRSMRDRHVNMHLDLRPFHCPVCAKKFKMKHHLTEHMKTHTGLKPYRCGGCARKFMWRDSYMRHRAQCERSGGGGGGHGGGGEEPMPSHFLLPSEEGGVGGRGNHSNAGMIASAAVAQGQGSGLPGGVGAGRDACDDEDPCEARANDGSVT